MKRDRRGFTLIELIVALSMAAVIVPAVTMAAYQFLRVPPQETQRLSVTNEVRQATAWISDDGKMAETFSTRVTKSDTAPTDPEEGDLWQDTSVTPNEIKEWTGSAWEDCLNPAYGTFTWTDRTQPDGDHVYDVVYRWEGHNLVREKTVQRWDEDLGDWVVLSTNVGIARHIQDFQDISFEEQVTHVAVTITSSIGDISKTTTVYIQPRTYFVVTGPGGWPWGPDAILGGVDSIHFYGDDTIVDGDIHSNDDVDVTGSDNVVSGEVQCQDLNDPSGLLDYGSLVEDGATLTMPDIGVPQDYFQNDLGSEGIYEIYDGGELAYYEFIFDGDVDLEDEDDVWHASDELHKGLYYTDGTLTLSNKDYISGDVTFIADNIVIAGKGIELSPCEGDLLLWATGSGADVIVISGGSWGAPCGTFLGSVFAPHGEISLSGSGSSVFGRAWLTEGAIVGREVTISGDNWFISRW
ncbi:MAG: prepilin-type N-terminal cleavage/methylation domain-containing protein [Chloroflexota bacterium]|nr:prepilin-type N-terminal cleavage/methylation domain-containing protein [Chloroflexota bacterium]